MKIPNLGWLYGRAVLSLARIVSEDSQLSVRVYTYFYKSSKDS